MSLLRKLLIGDSKKYQDAEAKSAVLKKPMAIFCGNGKSINRYKIGKWNKYIA